MGAAGSRPQGALLLSNCQDRRRPARATRPPQAATATSKRLPRQGILELDYLALKPLAGVPITRRSYQLDLTLAKARLTRFEERRSDARVSDRPARACPQDRLLASRLCKLSAYYEDEGWAATLSRPATQSTQASAEQIKLAAGITLPESGTLDVTTGDYLAFFTRRIDEEDFQMLLANLVRRA